MRRTQWMLVVIPAIVIGGFETIRHTLLEQLLPMELGNWITACIDAIVIALITRKLIDKFAQTERELNAERTLRLVLQERERVARVLHDQIAQTIFYSGVQLNQARNLALKAEHEDILQKLDDVGMSLREIDENVRQSIFNLREMWQDYVDIRSRFRAYLERALNGTDIEWDLMFQEDIEFSLNEQIQLFGIMQELVTNVIKHSSATQIMISVQQHIDDSSKWTFQLSDNGVGLNESQELPRKFGIDIVHSRAREIGAQVNIESSSSGVTVTIKTAEADQNDVLTV